LAGKLARVRAHYSFRHGSPCAHTLMGARSPRPGVEPCDTWRQLLHHTRRASSNDTYSSPPEICQPILWQAQVKRLRS
jgi:hypothetical protein